MMGIGTMPTQHPLYMGMLGNNGGMAANRAVVDADLVIMAGARLADRALSNPTELFKGKTLVHIDVDPAEIGKNAPVRGLFERLGFNLTEESQNLKKYVKPSVRFMI